MPPGGIQPEAGQVLVRDSAGALERQRIQDHLFNHSVIRSAKTCEYLSYVPRTGDSVVNKMVRIPPIKDLANYGVRAH